MQIEVNVADWNTKAIYELLEIAKLIDRAIAGARSGIIVVTVEGPRGATEAQNVST